MKLFKKIMLSIMAMFSLITIFDDHVILSANEIDLVKPVITGPTKIVKSSTTLLTSLDIQAMLTAVDDVDGNITGKIKISADSYSGYADKAGEYSISFKVQDSSLNIGFHIVKIVVNADSNMKNCVYTYDGQTSTIVVEPTTKLTANDFIKVLKIAGQISSTNYIEILVLEDQYSDFYDMQGNYVYILRIRALDGTDEEYTFYVEVKEDAFNNGDKIISGDKENDSTIETVAKGTTYIVTYPFVTLYKCGYWLITGKWPKVKWHEKLKWE